MDGVIDDLVQMVMSNPLLERPVAAGWVARAKARGRVWLGGKLAQAASHYLKRLARVFHADWGDTGRGNAKVPVL